MVDLFTARVALSDEVLVQGVFGEAVLLDLATGVYFGLNDTGTRFWHLLGQHSRADLAVRALVQEFDVDEETLRTDMTRLLQELVNAGLVTLHEDASGS